MLIVRVVQIGLISPPVGMNLFVLNALLDGVTLKQIFRAVWLFVLTLVLTLVVVLVVVVLEFPALSLRRLAVHAAAAPRPLCRTAGAGQVGVADAGRAGAVAHSRG